MKRLALWLGRTLTVAAVAFVLHRLWQQQEWLDRLHTHSALLLPLVAAAAALYGASQFTLSSAWIHWLRWWGQEAVDARTCHGLYGRTQVAKYLPGNVLHLAGRHWVGSRAGYRHPPLLAATLSELLGVVAVSAALGLAGVGWGRLHAAAGTIPSAGWLPSLLAAAVAGGVAAALLLPRLGRVLGIAIPPRPLAAIARGALLPYALYLLFFAIAGMILLALIVTGGGELDGAAAGAAVAAFAASWIAGFATPGAPGGIGIRETALIALLTPLCGEATAVAAALELRLVTTLGDLLFFLYTLRLAPLLAAGATEPR